MKYSLDLDKNLNNMSTDRINKTLRKCMRIHRKNLKAWKVLPRDADIKRAYALIPELVKTYKTVEEQVAELKNILGEDLTSRFKAHINASMPLVEENEKLDQIILRLELETINRK
jgi:hypothetical protein